MKKKHFISHRYKKRINGVILSLFLGLPLIVSNSFGIGAATPVPETIMMRIIVGS
ncbi:hypothetical protein NF212_15000 [Parasalinivibrio latis]